MRHLITISLLLFCAQSALAIDCDKAVNTLETNECASQEQKRFEIKLNQVYQGVLKELEQPDTESENYSDMKRTLLAAQRAWVKFRQADCDSIYSRNASGTIRNVMYISCMQKHAEERIKQLEAY